MSKNLLTKMILVCLFAISFSTEARAQDTAQTVSATAFTADQRGNFGFILRDSYVLATENSALFAYRSNGTYVCTSVDDPHCNLSKVTNWNAIVIAPPCQIDSSSVCVDSLSIKDKEGNISSALFERVIRTDSSFVGSAKYNLPSGSSTSLWTANTLTGTKHYAVHLREQLSSINPQQDGFTPYAFELNIAQFESRPVASARNIKTFEGTYPNGTQGSMGIGSPQGINCVWQENSVCGVEQVMDPGEEITISFQIPNAISGWLHGRLMGPKIETRNLSDSHNLMTVSGRPAEVPTVSAFVPYGETNEAMKKFYSNNPHAKIGDTVGFFISSVGETALSYLEAFKDVIKDKATNKFGVWSIGSITSTAFAPKNRCISESQGFVGLVTSNAMVYSDLPPTFDGNAFNYSVGGLHFDVDGNVFMGSYTLSIASTVVRCLYGLSTSPIYATVSITGESGEQKIFTSTFVEENGWAILSANGFTFSKPQISVKFSQIAERTVSAPETSTVKTKLPPVIKKSVVCINGKITKKPALSSGKCPKGFKKLLK